MSREKRKEKSERKAFWTSASFLFAFNVRFFVFFLSFCWFIWGGCFWFLFVKKVFPAILPCFLHKTKTPTSLSRFLVRVFLLHLFFSKTFLQILLSFLLLLLLLLLLLVMCLLKFHLRCFFATLFNIPFKNPICLNFHVVLFWFNDFGSLVNTPVQNIPFLKPKLG